MVNGKAVKSSAIPSKEFTAGAGSLPAACDQTALRCSGSGALAGDSFMEKFFDHGVPNEADAGVRSDRSIWYKLSMSSPNHAYYKQN